MEVSEKLLKLIFDHVLVYEESITTYSWEFDKNDDFVRQQKIRKHYYFDYGEERCEISLEEYTEFLNLEALLKEGK